MHALKVINNFYSMRLLYSCALSYYISRNYLYIWHVGHWMSTKHGVRVMSFLSTHQTRTPSHEKISNTALCPHMLQSSMTLPSSSSKQPYMLFVYMSVFAHRNAPSVDTQTQPVVVWSPFNSLKIQLMKMHVCGIVNLSSGFGGDANEVCITRV